MTLLHIVDVSAYQGTTVPAVDAVLIKATEGSTYKSSKFAAQWASAGRRAKHRGAYHFARPEASSAKSQADRFLDVVRPVAGESLWLDLEASGLNQAKTHAWAVAWADRIRDEAPGITYGIYLGSGYASNNTGKGLAAEYPLWWYPQYPNAYQLAQTDVETLRTANRTDAVVARTSIAAKTSRWPTAVEPWLPSGLTFGKKMPDIWQFTDNWQGYDASVSALTLDQLAGGGGPTPLEDSMPYGGQVPSRENVMNGYAIAEFSFPNEFAKTIGLVSDHTYSNPDAGYEAQPPAQVRVTAHRKGRKGEVLKDPTKGSPTYGTEVITVGSTDGDGWADKVVLHVKDPNDIDYISVVRLDQGKRPVGVDMS